MLCNCKEKEYAHDPRECTPEQIRKCHGDVKEHPCERPSSKKQDSDKK